MSLAVQQLIIVIVGICVFLFHGKYIVICRALSTTFLRDSTAQQR